MIVLSSVGDNKKLKEHKSRTKRKQRRSIERNEERKAHSLAASSTPVNTRPIQKTNNPKDDIQDRKLPPIKEENIATASAESTIQQDKDHSSDSSCDSNTSEIKRRKIRITTEKKK